MLTYQLVQVPDWQIQLPWCFLEIFNPLKGQTGGMMDCSKSFRRYVLSHGHPMVMPPGVCTASSLVYTLILVMTRTINHTSSKADFQFPWCYLLILNECCALCQ